MIEPTLTSLTHGGGCGCKLSPEFLQNILSQTPAARGFTDLVVGNETSDDAAAWRLNDDQILVATTDFFTPIVDDPFDFGRIAATNALSDVYAMGATPIFALAIVGMPIEKLSAAAIGSILAGGADVCAAAGIPIAGGHSIELTEPIYGLVAIGIAQPSRLMKNSTGRVGDALILTKALGVGVLSAAFKQKQLDAAGYAVLIELTTLLNRVGVELSSMSSVHAMTDVTGFGLLGHAFEMCLGAGLSAEIFSPPPMLPGVEFLARAEVRTGAARRNMLSYEGNIVFGADIEIWCRDLLYDPQTSGGLLVAVDPQDADIVVELARLNGFPQTAVVGRLDVGPPAIRVV